MGRVLVLCVALLALGSGFAWAAGGVNLGWGECGGLPGTELKTFACDSNTLTDATLIGSFMTGAQGTGGVPVVGLYGVLDVQTAVLTIPNWWKLLGSGSCRAALRASFDFTNGPFACPFPWANPGSGGAMVSWTSGPKQLRIRTVCGALSTDRVPLAPSTEYYAFKLTLLGAKTVGQGACAGCTVPACIVLNTITAATDGEAHNRVFTAPSVRNFVSWQSLVPGCPGITPAINKSWGQIKSLYW
jgi:hypothetical protein